MSQRCSSSRPFVQQLEEELGIPSNSSLPVVLVVFLQVSWSPDSTQLISASGDKTVKLWDVGAGTAVTTFTMGTDVNDQQLGCLWQKEHLLSISLSGFINYLDRNNPDRPIRTIKVRMDGWRDR